MAVSLRVGKFVSAFAGRSDGLRTEHGMSEHGEPTPGTRARHAATPPSRTGLSIVVSDDPYDPVWDSFVESVPDASYSQTSSWGRARAEAGWHAIRSVVFHAGEPVAGVQVEIKRLRGIGDVGFVYCGPVAAPDRDDAREAAIEAVHALEERCRLRYLAVRPPRTDGAIAAVLQERGFARGMLDHLYIYFDYAVTLDLADGEAAVMARLNKKRRQNIRFAAKQGVTVRQAGAEALDVFIRLEDRHAARLGYDRREDGYFRSMWRSMSERGHVRLFLAEYEDEPICAQLVIPFGNTSYHMERPWSGEHPELSATELVEWEAIRWAANDGYRYVDLGGLDTLVGEAAVSGREDPRANKYGASLFKLKWGGDVVAEPPFLDYVYNPVLRYLYRHVPDSVMRSSWLEKAAKQLKESGT